MTDLAKYDERIQKLERREVAVQLFMASVAMLLALTAVTHIFPAGVVMVLLFMLGVSIGALMGPKFLR